VNVGDIEQGFVGDGDGVGGGEGGAVGETVGEADGGGTDTATVVESSPPGLWTVSVIVYADAALYV
jgi:hypothetical protein